MLLYGLLISRGHGSFHLCQETDSSDLVFVLSFDTEEVFVVGGIPAAALHAS